MPTDREVFEGFVRDTKKTAEQMGNHNVSEKHIREECQKIADRVDRKQSEEGKKNGS